MVGRIGRSRALVLAGVALVLAVTACSTSTPTSAPTSAPSGTAAGGAVTTSDDAGLVPLADWRARQDDFLRWATREPLAPGSSNSIMAHAERSAREPSFAFDAHKPQPADYAKVFAKLDAFEDTGDFDVNGMLFAYSRYRDRLDPALVKAWEDQFLTFKYWWTEPTPAGIVDSQYYWTENHQIIFLANELVAGQLLPDRTFTNSGMTGRQHVEHAKPLIRRWLDLRARFGWSEWLSNVYYGEDLEGLLLIVEQSDDPDLVTRASSAIDVLLFEMASHLQAGAFGSTHGRSYMKDKMTALDEDNFSLAKMLFDDTSYDYQHNDIAVLFAIAQRYRLPEVIRKVARADDTAVVRHRASLPLDPTTPYAPNPTAPYGFDYQDPDNLMVWWGIGGQFAWPVVPISVDSLKRYDLWKTTNFQQALELKPVIESSSIEDLQKLGVSLAKPLNAGLLSEVNTYTWRSPDAMLSTAQDWRAGQRGEQDHIWQATIDANAQVFTTHPSDPVPDGDDWHTNSGYWTGDGAMPRSAQFENVGISVYAPQYQPPTKSLGYEDFTHAYFPQDAFDEVRQEGNWTFGRKGDGYVALYSYRPTRWVQYDGVTHPTRGMQKPFELIADGGPDNVWIVEVGNAAMWKDQAGAKGGDAFAAFVAAVAGAKVDVAPNPTTDPADRSAGYAVSYTSPTKGTLTFGFGAAATANPPFAVDGKDVPLRDYPRVDSPYAHVAFDTKTFVIETGGSKLALDFDAGTRTPS